MNKPGKNYLSAKGEISGAFLLGITQAFHNLNALPSAGLNLNSEQILPDNWYPHQMLVDTLKEIDDINPSDTMFFQAGIKFIQIWYEYGPGKTMIHSGLDWLYANQKSGGYNSVVRGGNPDEIGWCILQSIDIEKGIAVYENVMPLHPNYIKGVFYGGCCLFSDMDYIEVDSTSEIYEPNPTFLRTMITVRFHLKSKIDNEKLERKISNWQESPELLSKEEIDTLVWQNKGFKISNRIETEYNQNIIGILAESIKTIQQTEQVLIESEKKLRVVFETANVGIAILNCNGKFEIFNNYWLQLLGYNSDELNGLTNMEITHVDDLEISRINMLDLSNGKTNNFRIEKRYIKKDKSILWVDISVSAIKDENKNIINYIGVIKDITQRKKAENEIRKLSTALIQSPTSIVITDLKGTIEYTNPQFTNITGYAQEEVIGKNSRILKSDYHRPNYYKDLWDTVISGNIWKGELYNKHKNGSLFWEEAVIAPIFDDNNQIISIVAVKQDITERKKIEFKHIRNKGNLKKAQKIGNVGHWDYNIVENKLYWSEQIYRIYEVSPDDFELNFENVIQLLHPEDRQLFVDEYYKSIENNEIFEIGHRIITKSGKTKYIIQRATTKYDEVGKPLSSLGSVQDITELKEKEIQLKELNTTKDKFFSIISHDLRSPFNSILGFSELLLKNHSKYDNEEREYFINTIYMSAKNTLSLLDNLLTWARSQSGKINLSKENINLKFFLKELTLILQEQANNKKIEIKNHITENILVFADRNMLDTIFRNLITNAIKYTNEGGIIELKQKTETEFVEITIADNGVGMNEKIRNSLFKTGETKSIEGTDGERGTGLGLILCKEFVEKHGGKIWVESEFGKGATFYFTIPYEPTGVVKKDIESNQQITNQISNITILVAEDQEFNFNYLEAVLSDYSCKVIHAKNGHEAVDLCRQNPNINLVLMDIKMPFMDGQAATKLIKEIRPDLPIIAQTAYAIASEIEKYQGIFNDYITKPISIEKLEDILVKFINHNE
jgi:PAS domain S-box-containing protein